MGSGFLHLAAAACPADLLARAKERGTCRLLVVRAAAALPMEAAFEAVQADIVEPVLVGEPEIIKAEAEKLGWIVPDDAIIPAVGEAEAASVSADLLRRGLAGEGPEINAVMKGQLHTDVFMGALLDKSVGLRTGNRLVHVFAIFPPDGSAPVMVSDAAVNVSPDDKTKQQSMTQMARLSPLIGQDRPRLAVLSATETPIESMPASLEAAHQADWARAHLSEVDVSGPLSFDLALSATSVELKGLVGDDVAGRANCFLLPEIVAGNILYKAFVYLGGGCAAGIVVGGAVPVLLTSRADPAAARLASVALAALAC